MSHEEAQLERIVNLGGDRHKILEFYEDWASTYARDVVEGIGYTGHVLTAKAVAARKAAEAEAEEDVSVVDQPVVPIQHAAYFVVFAGFSSGPTPVALVHLLIVVDDTHSVADTMSLHKRVHLPQGVVCRMVVDVYDAPERILLLQHRHQVPIHPCTVVV